MLRHLLIFCISLMLIVSFQNRSFAQYVEVYGIPGDFTRFGEPLIHNDELYYKIYDKVEHGNLVKVLPIDESIDRKFAIKVIEPPLGYDGNHGGYIRPAFTFQGELYLYYRHNTNNFHLFKLVGDNLVRIQYDEPGGGYPVLFNNEMYFISRRNLAKLTGGTIEVIDSYEDIGFERTSEPFVFQDKLYFFAQYGYSSHYLYVFDGDSIQQFAYLEFEYFDTSPKFSPIPINDKVYMKLGKKLYEFDGESFTQIVSNIDLDNSSPPRVIGNEIFYRGISNYEGFLLKYKIGDSQLEAIENPPGSSPRVGVVGTNIFIYKNEKYLQFDTRGGPNLAKINDSGSIEILSNEVNRFIHEGRPIVHNDLLYFRNNKAYLTTYDGDSFSIAYTQNRYYGYPIVFKNNLFFGLRTYPPKLGRLSDEEPPPPPLGTDINDSENLYPNPASDHIFINTERPTSITIIDTLGKDVLNGLSNERIDISSLKSGVYFVQYEGGETLKFIKD